MSISTTSLKSWYPPVLVFLFGCLSVLDELDGVAYVLDGLRLVIGNLDVELLLKFHDQLDGIKTISTQVLAKGSLGSYLRLANT